MAEEHETVHKVGSYETCAASYKNPFALRWGQKLDWREPRQCSIRDRLGVRMIDRFRLVRGVTLDELCMLRFLRVSIESVDIFYIIGRDNVVRTKVQGAKDIDRDLAIETKSVEAHRSDLVPVLIESFYLTEKKYKLLAGKRRGKPTGE